MFVNLIMYAVVATRLLGSEQWQIACWLSCNYGYAIKACEYLCSFKNKKFEEKSSLKSARLVAEST